MTPAKTRKRTKPQTAYYVDNEKFLEAILDYKKKADIARINDWPRPKMSNYLGSCFMKIAMKLSNSRNFINYPFKEDMISEAVHICIRYIETFDETRTQNPFAYFTQTVKYAFINQIQKEKKYLYTKYKAIQNTESFGVVSDRQQGDGGDYSNDVQYSENAKQNMMTFIKEFEDKAKEKKDNKNGTSGAD